MHWFPLLTLAGWLTIVTAAFVLRSKPFAIFVTVVVGVYSLAAVGIFPAFHAVAPIFTAFHVAVYVNFASLSRPRMRPLAFRLLVSWPASFFYGGTLLALPWSVLTAVGLHPWAPSLPYVLAGIGLVQSFTTKREVLDVVVAGPDGEHATKLAPHPHGNGREERPLRIVQITDPHLGPFMSVARLRRICERAVEAKPDLVFLTGDFLTMESQADPDDLLKALEPFRKMPGRVFACHGNHDHECPELVARALAKNGIALLIDEARVVSTDAGDVQVLGMDYAWRDRKGHLERVCAAHPREPGALRVVLLHDPGAFKHLPPGEGDLVLSGHTHGGQVGLISLGMSWTFLRLFGDKVPDHGFWARGTDRMYIHRGTGHYGFPLRLGVPAEESVLHVHRAPASPVGVTGAI